MSVLQKNAAGKILYCVAYNLLIGGKWTSELVYMHADDQGNAKLNFILSMSGKTYQIVDVAPAIGFHVADNHGEKLIA